MEGKGDVKRRGFKPSAPFPLQLPAPRARNARCAVPTVRGLLPSALLNPDANYSPSFNTPLLSSDPLHASTAWLPWSSFAVGFNNCLTKHACFADQLCIVAHATVRPGGLTGAGGRRLVWGKQHGTILCPITTRMGSVSVGLWSWKIAK